jgi:anti-sigma regulatory factor (Ser/Thr protein kinase)
VGPLSGSSHRRHEVAAEEDVGAVRRAVAAQAARLPGLPAGDAELVATELATNILRHSRGGYVLHRENAGGIELIAVDRGCDPAAAPPYPRTAGEGPAVGTVPRPVLFGGSGRGGLGVGLAAVQRRAAMLDWYATEAGAVVLVELRPAVDGESTAAATVGDSTVPRWRWGAVEVPYADGGESGDAWAVSEKDGRLAVLVVDGLGHGPEAAKAARAALTAFAGTDPVRLTAGGSAGAVLDIHAAMLGTRGGVLGLCVLDPDDGRIAYTGVGNVTGRVLTRSTGRHLLTHPGMLGTRMRPPQPRTDVQPWPSGACLVMASDGVRTQWDLGPYPGLLGHHPTVVAATLHRDLARGTDDATVLVVQELTDRHIDRQLTDRTP